MDEKTLARQQSFVRKVEEATVHLSSAMALPRKDSVVLPVNDIKHFANALHMVKCLCATGQRPCELCRKHPEGTFFERCLLIVWFSQTQTKLFGATVVFRCGAIKTATVYVTSIDVLTSTKTSCDFSLCRKWLNQHTVQYCASSLRRLLLFQTSRRTKKNIVAILTVLDAGLIFMSLVVTVAVCAVLLSIVQPSTFYWDGRCTKLCVLARHIIENGWKKPNSLWVCMPAFFFTPF